MYRNLLGAVIDHELRLHTILPMVHRMLQEHARWILSELVTEAKKADKIDS